MKTLTTEIGKLTLRPIVMDVMFNGMLEGVEIKNEEGKIANISDISINEITDKTVVSLFNLYSKD